MPAYSGEGVFGGCFVCAEERELGRQRGATNREGSCTPTYLPTHPSYPTYLLYPTYRVASCGERIFSTKRLVKVSRSLGKGAEAEARAMQTARLWTTCKPKQGKLVGVRDTREGAVAAMHLLGLCV